ncbi:hypothetical protein MAIT1_05381 [Magnetofaba australis IT-1]|uniref:Uncharacterized protein n=2 Tax=Magnetofaba TaxID=1472292 RepID=A0A1Y2K2A0_9PROT|nr:hypothetical protein MAIT1_05381 [Magnetofaba australis IT-1]
MVAQQARSDAHGVFAVTLPRAGWWAVSVRQPHGVLTGPNGVQGPLERVTTLWIAVDEPPGE